MGVKERQEREREAVSRAILDAARELFVTYGYQEVSIRKIASLLGLSVDDLGAVFIAHGVPAPYEL